MKGMPLPFDFQGKGGFLFDSDSPLQSNLSLKLMNKNINNNSSFVGFTEPNFLLDNNIISSPSPRTSTSTLSSSLSGGSTSGGSGYADTAGVAAVSGKPKCSPADTNAGPQLHHPILTDLDGGGGPITTTTSAAPPEKCGMGLEDWESVLSESVAASPGQEQSILRWIMGDVDDPSMGLNKVLQIGGGSSNTPPPADFDFNSGFGVVDQGGFMFDPSGNFIQSSSSNFPNNKFEKFGGLNLNPNPNSNPVLQNPLFSNQMYEPEIKPQIFNNPHQQIVINQHQTQLPQNPPFFLPLYEQEQQHLVTQPNPKRHNPGHLESGPKSPFLDSGQPIQGLPHQLHLLPPHLHQRSTPSMVGAATATTKLKTTNEEFPPHQQAVIDQLYKAADMVQSGNPIHAQGILARLNQHLSPIGKPFHRAAFYIKESLQLLVQPTASVTPPSPNSPFNLIFKIGAYKSFSEISPIVQFANFTCNQALLEALEGYNRIHIIDFDIGYGGQWASLMQELALRCGGPPAVKITVFVSPSTHDQLELGLARENLSHFASDINISFEFEMLNIDALNSNSWPFPHHNEGIAVNLPVGSFFNYQISLPLVLRFIKHLSPKIVVSVDRGCDRTDLPFPNHVIHILQSYSNLLESLDAVNVNLDALQKIERFLLQPGIEKIVMGRYRSPEKTQHWRTLFLTAGFSPLNFSNFTESQAECVVKRTPIRGFHVEKRQSSLVFCWQRRELISASVWKC